MARGPQETRTSYVGLCRRKEMRTLADRTGEKVSDAVLKLALQKANENDLPIKAINAVR